MFNISVSASRSSFVVRSNSGYWFSAVAASGNGMSQVMAIDSDGVIYVFGPDTGTGASAMRRAYKCAVSSARAL